MHTTRLQRHIGVHDAVAFRVHVQLHPGVLAHRNPLVEDDLGGTVREFLKINRYWTSEGIRRLRAAIRLQSDAIKLHPDRRCHIDGRIRYGKGQRTSAGPRTVAATAGRQRAERQSYKCPSQPLLNHCGSLHDATIYTVRDADCTAV